MGHYSSFILRLWVEADQGWRWGLIEHVASRERTRFSSPEEMLDFIQAHSEVNELSLPFILESDDTAPDAPLSGNQVTQLPISKRKKKTAQNPDTKPPRVIDGS